MVVAEEPRSASEEEVDADVDLVDDSEDDVVAAANASDIGVGNVLRTFSLGGLAVEDLPDGPRITPTRPLPPPINKEPQEGRTARAEMKRFVFRNDTSRHCNLRLDSSRARVS